MTDVLPGAVLELLEGPYRAAAEGHQRTSTTTARSTAGNTAFDSGRSRIPTARSSAGSALSEDVTADRARQTTLEQMQQLSNVGTVSYNRIGGWLVDDQLITLLGTDSGLDVLQAMGSFIVPDDRERTLSEFRSVLAAGGETTQQYRLIHGKTGQLRHVIGTIRAIVDANGALLRVVATHADVTDVIEGQSARVEAADARTALLRSVSEALANAPGSVEDMLQSIVDVSTAALGDGSILSLLTADGSAVEADMTCFGDGPVAERANACLRQFHDDGSGVLDSSGPAGDLWSSIRNGQRRSDFTVEWAIRSLMTSGISSPRLCDMTDMCWAIFGFIGSTA